MHNPESVPRSFEEISFYSLGKIRLPLVTASLHKFPELFSVCWPISIMDGLHLFSSLLLPLPIHCGLFKAHQLQLVSRSPSCSIVLFSSLARSRYLSLFSLSFNFAPWSARTAKSTIRPDLFFVDYH